MVLVRRRRTFVWFAQSRFGFGFVGGRGGFLLFASDFERACGGFSDIRWGIFRGRG